MTTTAVDLRYVCQESEVAYAKALTPIVIQNTTHSARIQTSLDLVAFPSRYGTFCLVADRARWGPEAASEQRAWCPRSVCFFHMWYCTEFFAVPGVERRRFYPSRLPDWDTTSDVPELLVVPTPPVLAYYASTYLRLSAYGDLDSDHRVIVQILLSEWTILV